MFLCGLLILVSMLSLTMMRLLNSTDLGIAWFLCLLPHLVFFLLILNFLILTHALGSKTLNLLWWSTACLISNSRFTMYFNLTISSAQHVNELIHKILCLCSPPITCRRHNINISSVGAILYNATLHYCNVKLYSCINKIQKIQNCKILLVCVYNSMYKFRYKLLKVIC